MCHCDLDSTSDPIGVATGSHSHARLPTQQSAERCVSTLLDLIQTKVNYVVQEAIVVIKDIFRKYPNKYVPISPLFFLLPELPSPISVDSGEAELRKCTSQSSLLPGALVGQLPVCWRPLPDPI